MALRTTCWLRGKWDSPSHRAWFFRVLPVMLALIVWIGGTVQPMILFAVHNGVFVLRPLETKFPRTLWQKLVGVPIQRGFHRGSIYVDGSCFVCGEPFAPHGTFVLAALPKGLAVAMRKPGAFNHVSDPRYVRYEWVFLASLVLGWLLAVPAARLAKRRRTGHCTNCGYDLRGNVSGTCPECGTPCAQAWIEDSAAGCNQPTG